MKWIHTYTNCLSCISNFRLFFRRHYPVSAVTFCGMDPDDRRWTRQNEETGQPMNAKWVMHSYFTFWDCVADFYDILYIWSRDVRMYSRILPLSNPIKHFLLECPLYTNERNQMLNDLNALGFEPLLKSLLYGNQRYSR